MQQNNGNAHNKQTPGRRRPSRNAQSSRKTYASENDVPTDDYAYAPQDFVSSRPRTPSKAQSGSPAPASQQANAKSRQRNSAKSRSKNGATSPHPTKPERHTPPQTAAAKLSSSTAFAGATFHASPAPSSLPIPSFLNRAAAHGSPGASDFAKLSGEPSPPQTDPETPTPVYQSPAAAAAREESPLDILFQADRAEKEEARRTASANVLAWAGGPWSPPSRSESPRHYWTLPRGPASQQQQQQQQRRQTARHNSNVGISTTELNGTPGKLMGPAFSTPYQERIKAARSAEKSAPPFSGLSPQQRAPVLDRSEALKNYLFAGQRSSPPGGPWQNTMGQSRPPTTTTTTTTTTHTAGTTSGVAVSQVQHVSAPSTTARSGDGRSADILMMEDNLRRILKLS